METQNLAIFPDKLRKRNKKSIIIGGYHNDINQALHVILGALYIYYPSSNDSWSKHNHAEEALVNIYRKEWLGNFPKLLVFASASVIPSYVGVFTPVSNSHPSWLAPSDFWVTPQALLRTWPPVRFPSPCVFRIRNFYTFQVFIMYVMLVGDASGSA